jgi:hypothetical protein
MINQGLQRNRSSGLVAVAVVIAVDSATYLVLPEALRSSTKVVLSLQAASVAIFGLSVVGLRGQGRGGAASLPVSVRARGPA